MNLALFAVGDVAFVQGVPRCTPLRLAPGCGYAEQVWSMQASGFAGRMGFCPSTPHRPNQPLNRGAKPRRCSVPATLRVPAPG